MRKSKRKIVSISCALALCGILGVMNYLNPQEPVILETISDNLTAENTEKAGKGDISSMNLDVKSAILIDADTGKVLIAQNAHEELPPASVTKVMTMLLVMEAIDDGKAKLTDKITISDRAASMGGSQMYMEVGETHTLEELLEGIAMVSANDACVAYNLENFLEKIY